MKTNLKRKYTIQVRLYTDRNTFIVRETIERVLWAEQIGNFNPIFCRYQHKRTLVHSTLGDLSDPFRREDSLLTKLYIKIEGI